jgi:hypothetical protein
MLFRSVLFVSPNFSKTRAQPDDGSFMSATLLTIGLASEAALHGWRPLRLQPRDDCALPGSNLAFYLIGSLVELAPPSGNADQIIRRTWLK